MLKIKVAVAEDFSIIRKGILFLLKGQEQIEISHISEDGQELINHLNHASQLPDVVLLDIDMPVMDGFETARIIRENYPQIKIIYLTAMLQSDYLNEVDDSRGDAFITKDLDAESLMETITGVLADQPGC